MNEFFPQRAVHLDFHTMPRVPDVGAEFDAGAFARTLSEAHVEYVTVFAKCNLGMAYYPTKVGTVHPGMVVHDMLGPMVTECHKRDIRVAAYINTGLDHEQALRHREWCKVDSQGRVYKIEEMGNFFRTMCLNSGYRLNVMGMIEEVLSSYPLDGLFLDCINLSPCYGVECLDAMKAREMDIFDESEVARFQSEMTDEFLAEVEDRVATIRPGINVYFNGIRYTRQPTHIEMEVLPTGSWGYDYLPFVIRYARTLRRPYFTMTGRFHKSWGDLGGLRTEHSLLYDCYYSIANGGTCSIGDHMHPRGRLDPAVYDLVERTYRRVMEIEEWTAGSESEAEIVVIDPALSGVPGEVKIHRSQGHSLQGAARMLSELNCQFDLSGGGSDIGKYRVVVLAGDVTVDGELAPVLKQHLDRGGSIISSAYAGLDSGRGEFALSDYRIRFEGPEPHSYTFFRALPGVAQGMPEMLTTIYDSGIAMVPGEGAETLAELHRPYFNHLEWDGYHEQFYCPPQEDTGRPALVRCGNVFHFSFPIFRSYIRHAPVPYRTLVGNCLGLALADPMVKVENFPSFGQVTLGRQGDRRLVHLLLYMPELRGKSQVVEEPLLARDIRVSLRSDRGEISRCYLAPSGKELPLSRDDPYISVTVPETCGYQLVVFES